MNTIRFINPPNRFSGSTMQTVARIFLVPFLMYGASYAQAEDFVKVPLKINVLTNVTVKKDDITEIVKGANKILKKTNVQLEYDPKKNFMTGFSDQGSGTGKDDGEIALSEVGKLAEAGQRELDKAFKPGKGIKLFIANEIFGDPKKMGATLHAKKPAADKPKAKPHVLLKTSGRTKEQSANDLAHEVSHLLTLGPGHKIDDSKNADSRGHHDTDTNNLMTPSLTSGGSDLTKDQKAEVLKGAKQLGMAKNKKKESAPVLTPLNQIHGGWVDDEGETSNDYTDLGFGKLYAESDTSDLEFELLFEGLFPAVSPIDLTINAFFDSDNNVGTGSTFGGAIGVDMILDIIITGMQPEGPFAASLFKVATNETLMLSDGFTGRIGLIADSTDELAGPEVFDFVDGLHQFLPLTFFDSLAEDIPVVITLNDNITGDFDDVVFLWDVFDYGPDDPLVDLLTTMIRPGELLQLAGINFTPLMDIDILLDDELLGTAPVAGDGSFFASFTMPQVSAGNYFITARDGVKGSDFSIAMVPVPEPTTLSILTFGFAVLGWRRKTD